MREVMEKMTINQALQNTIQQHGPKKALSSKINGEYKGNDLVAEVINFISKDKKRPICTPLSE